uniref:Helix-turn-helix domain-containing protein n=1 Tax=Bosea sp. NBC_00436 TaxID=2969620 RepID=A0A9E7ZRK3_9HYPH
MNLSEPFSARMLLAQNLRHLRERSELSVSDLAERTGISAKRLGGIENGRIDAHLDDLDRLASGVGVSLAALFKAEGF